MLSPLCCMECWWEVWPWKRIHRRWQNHSQTGSLNDWGEPCPLSNNNGQLHEREINFKSLNILGLFVIATSITFPKTSKNLILWKKSQNSNETNAGEDLEHQKLPFIAGGNPEWCSPLEHCLVLQTLKKTKHAIARWSSNEGLWYLPKWVETYLHKNLQIYVYNSFTHGCQNLDITKIRFNRWTDKQTVV